MGVWMLADSPDGKKRLTYMHGQSQTSLHQLWAPETTYAYTQTLPSI